MKIHESETQRTEGLEAGGDASQNLKGDVSHHLRSCESEDTNTRGQCTEIHL
jgi:hypothetical protein